MDQSPLHPGAFGAEIQHLPNSHSYTKSSLLHPCAPCVLWSGTGCQGWNNTRLVLAFCAASQGYIKEDVFHDDVAVVSRIL